jgi:hypothetical protein
MEPIVYISEKQWSEAVTVADRQIQAPGGPPPSTVDVRKTRR